ncbi:unnamed protein product [Pedinophyceae sp. YPF-701]|nr:unnamed protein product [Pedinophyceae sp. YPF-701]
MAAKAEEQPPDPRLINSVVYNDNISELKDDLPALLDAMKTGGKEGGMRRETAAFMLWHHAMNDPAKRLEIINSNGSNICLRVLEDDAKTSEKTAALGLLNVMSAEEADPDARGIIAGGKAPSGNLCGYIVAGMLSGTESQGVAAAAILRNLVQHDRGRSILQKCLLPWRKYLDTLRTSGHEDIQLHVCEFLLMILQGQDELIVDVAACPPYAFSVLIGIVQEATKEETIVAALRLLELLMTVEENHSQFLKANATLNVLDILGDPNEAPPLPQDIETVLKEPDPPPKLPEIPEQPEKDAFSLGVDVNKPPPINTNLKAAGGSGATPGGTGAPTRGSTATGSLPPTPWGGVAGGKELPSVAPTPKAGAPRTALGGGAEEAGGGGKSAPVQLPEITIDYEPPRSRIRSRISLRVHRRAPPRSGFAHSVPAQAAACGALWPLLHREEVRDLVSANTGAWRICRALAAGCEHIPEGAKQKKGKAGGKGKKGKGLSLTPEGEDLVDRALGCLRHLSLLDTDKVRIARCDILKFIVELVGHLGKARVRWNARALMGNVSVMHENAELLNAGAVPEEFRGFRCIYLTKEQRSDLKELFW